MHTLGSSCWRTASPILLVAGVIPAGLPRSEVKVVHITLWTSAAKEVANMWDRARLKGLCMRAQRAIMRRETVCSTHHGFQSGGSFAFRPSRATQSKS